MGRFINADVFVSTGHGLLGNNMFAYCNNNPVIYTDMDGERLVGIGITVDVTTDNGTFGVDVIIYIDDQVIKEAGKDGSSNTDFDYVVVAYTYSGLTFSTEDVLDACNVSTVIAALASGDFDLSALSKTNCDEFLIALNALLSQNATFSGGAFLLFGNEEFTSPWDYSGPFDCYSVSVRKIGSSFSGTGFVSTSDSCTAVGLKASISTGIHLIPFSVSYSKTEYSTPNFLF